MLKIYDLKTEYKTNPDCVDREKPRFSWKMESDGQDVTQKSYQITVYSGERVIWDSGVVESGQSQRILYGGEPLESRQKAAWKVIAVTVDGEGRREEAESRRAEFQMGLLHREDWLARWIEPGAAAKPDTELKGAADERAEKQNEEIFSDWDRPAPYLRQEFCVRPGLKEARIYQTAHGLYETWMNGQLCTEDKFKPGLTSYYYRIQYQSSDITHLLNEGANCWSVMLGDGWWRGTTGEASEITLGSSFIIWDSWNCIMRTEPKKSLGQMKDFSLPQGDCLLRT